MKIIQFVADALGDASYVVVEGNVAAVVDPQRDVTPYVAAAREHGAEIRYVFETHVHNDYISGGRELAERGARVVAPAGANLEFPHLPVADGDEVELGGARIRAIAAPGHTYEHTVYLAIDAEGAVQGAFTGGAILMAAAGRSDLLGPDHTEELTRLQWETGQRLAALLPPAAEVLPTHGAGSFCSSSGTCGDRRAPLDVELGRNPLFLSAGFDAFRSAHLGTAAPIPGYYRHMAPINRAGPRVYGEPPRPPAVTLAEIGRLRESAAFVLDVRTRADHAAGHLHGATGIEEGGSMLAYVGWLVPFNAPLGIVSYDVQQAERATTDLFRIGYEDVRGFITAGSPGVAKASTDVIRTVDVVQAAELLKAERPPLFDLRFRYEQLRDPLPGATERPIDQFNDWAHEVEDGTLLVCGSGQRATMAASLLQARGRTVVVLREVGAIELRAILAASA